MFVPPLIYLRTFALKTFFFTNVVSQQSADGSSADHSPGRHLVQTATTAQHLADRRREQERAR
jgi:hypothetical protein